jgi:hypothetical protein
MKTMKMYLVLAFAVALAGCSFLNPVTEPLLGISSERTCDKNSGGYSTCTTTIVERDVVCIGSCATKQ